MAIETDDLSTCRHGMTYDASQHDGCVVCRREAGRPSVAPVQSPPEADGSRVTRVIFGALAVLAVVVALAVVLSELLPDGSPDADAAEGAPRRGLAVNERARAASTAEDVPSSPMFRRRGARGEERRGGAIDLAAAQRGEAEERAESQERAAADQRDQAERRNADLDRARGRVEITVYTTSWCPHCVRAKAYMDQEGIRYTDRDVEASDANRAARERLGSGSGVPAFDVDGEVLVGFSPGALEAAITLAAERLLQ